jgi:hypothetical protein
MPKGLSRWRLLTIFAACNLAFWLGAAAIVGLFVSDSVDLGVETSIRKYQATIVAALSPSVVHTPEVAVLRTQASPSQATIMGAVKPQPTATSFWLATPTASLSPFVVQEPTIVQPETTSPSLQATPRALVPTIVGVPASLPATATPPEAAPVSLPATLTPLASTPQSVEALVESPLLLADPGFKDLTEMNTEMRQSAVGRAVQIRFQEAALNQAISALIEGNDQVPYRDVHVELKRGQVAVSGTATVLGFPVNTKIVGTLEAVNCVPQVEVQSISVEGILTPTVVKDQIEAMFLEALTWYPADYPLCLQQIVVEEGRATVYATRR